MNILGAFIIYQIIWWVVFMAVLPVDIKVEENPQVGFATSAPVKPNIKKKIILATKITTVLWIISCAAIITLT
jgi:predicted secreted protein